MIKYAFYSYSPGVSGEFSPVMKWAAHSSSQKMKYSDLQCISQLGPDISMLCCITPCYIHTLLYYSLL